MAPVHIRHYDRLVTNTLSTLCLILSKIWKDLGSRSFYNPIGTGWFNDLPSQFFIWMLILVRIWCSRGKICGHLSSYRQQRVRVPHRNRDFRSTRHAKNGRQLRPMGEVYSSSLPAIASLRAFPFQDGLEGPRRSLHGWCKATIRGETDRTFTRLEQRGDTEAAWWSSEL